jgi:DNA polymerase
MARVARYCQSDVEVEDALLRRINFLPPEEQAIWQLDQTINERGLHLDVPLIQAMRRIANDAIVPLAKEFSGLTGLEFTQTGAVRAWVESRGVPLGDLRKETIARLLGDDDGEEDAEVEDQDEGDEEDGAQVDLPKDVRRALSIRQLIGSASIKKLPKMEAMVCHDGRARRLLAYHAAHTGLWGGRLLQPQNFPRGTIREIGVDGKKVSPDIDSLVSSLMTGDPEYVEAVYGPPVETVVSSLRHTLVAAPGHVYLAGDYSSIQARLVLALAGEHEITARMAAGFSPYLDMATDIYGRPITKLDVEEYTIGKNTVLGCGFQMGDKTFHRRYCPLQPLSFATTCIRTYRDDWAPGVPAVWAALEEAALDCVWDAVTTEAYGIQFKREDRWLTARLHSGRKLWYYDPKAGYKKMPWSTEERPDIRRAWSFASNHGRKDMYGGLITQNVISGMARDLLVDAMFKAEAEGLPLVLNVHDQLLCEVEPDRADTKLIDSLMCDVAGWARALKVPVQADCWAGERFRK